MGAAVGVAKAAGDALQHNRFRWGIEVGGKCGWEGWVGSGLWFRKGLEGLHRDSCPGSCAGVQAPQIPQSCGEPAACSALPHPPCLRRQHRIDHIGLSRCHRRRRHCGRSCWLAVQGHTACAGCITQAGGDMHQGSAQWRQRTQPGSGEQTAPRLPGMCTSKGKGQQALALTHRRGWCRCCGRRWVGS